MPQSLGNHTYTFTLLDALGNPIPGTTTTDVWTDCLITAPSNLEGVVQQNWAQILSFPRNTLIIWQKLQYQHGVIMMGRE
jgi:hypothetical protein